MCTAHSAALSNIVMLLVISLAWMPGFVLRVRAPGKLIHDKLFGQEHIKLILLPSFAAAVLAAAGAVVAHSSMWALIRAGPRVDLMCMSAGSHMFILGDTSAIYNSRGPLYVILHDYAAQTSRMGVN